MITQALINSIKEEEGFSSHVYKDTLGVLTIGFGTNLKEGISREEAHALLEIRLKNKIKGLISAKPIVENINSVRQDVLANMAYQLGVTGVLKFKKMWEALDRLDFKTASKEMMDSKWYQQTPARCERLATQMYKG